MLYQKILPGKDPYLCFVGEGAVQGFGAHFHHEPELRFCMEGSFRLVVAGKEYTLHTGDLAVINSMAVHEIPPCAEPARMRLTVELGPEFLGEHFEPFVKQCGACRIFRAGEVAEERFFSGICRLLYEIARLRLQPSAFGEVILKGDLYKVSGLLLQYFSEHPESDGKSRQDSRFVEKALEIIYTRYSEQLELESVSLECGYGKSNFCKLFKQHTGETFHNLLNRHRIDVACSLLRERNLSVKQIASSVGFSDAAVFYRVFKQIMGESAGSYQKRVTPVA